MQRIEFAVCVLFVFARMNFCEDWFAGLIFRGVDQGFDSYCPVMRVQSYSAAEASDLAFFLMI